MMNRTGKITQSLMTSGLMLVKHLDLSQTQEEVCGKHLFLVDTFLIHLEQYTSTRDLKQA